MCRLNNHKQSLSFINLRYNRVDLSHFHKMVVVITKTILKNLRQKLKELRDHKRFSSWKTSLAYVAGGRLKGHVLPRIFQKWNCKINKFSVSNTKCFFSKLAFDNFLKTTKIAMTWDILRMLHIWLSSFFLVMR